MKLPGSASDPLWFKDAIIYELHVEGFYDSTGDGVGDFRGLAEQLDYLQNLGVTCLWLLPFLASPLRDDGYDVSDYRNIHPNYGTLEDFMAFMEAAHARRMQVIMELAINHTSDQHPWFERARRAAPGTEEREFYVWSDSNQRFADARVILHDSKLGNWTWDAEANAHYWHRFSHHEPDLNYDNPAVLREMLEVMDFWLEMGVDGLSLHAVPYLVEREGTTCENLPETHDVVKVIRRHIDGRYPNRMVLTQANLGPSDVRAYFGDGDEAHMAHHFPLMPRVFLAIHLQDRYPITEVLEKTPSIPDGCQWALFLRNHDELTLETVTEEERDYMYLAYTGEAQSSSNLAIRHRLAPLLGNDRRRFEVLTSLLFSFPGTPILYYGDEIGMGDNLFLGDRRGVRTPMQWNGDRNGGFSRADPQRLYAPVIMDPIYGYQAVNVEAQQRDPAGLLQWMRNMIGLRGLFKVFGRGSLEFLKPENRAVLVYLRRYETDTILCIANLSHIVQPVLLELARFAGLTPREMLGYTEFPVITEQPYFLTLGPYGFYWFELQRALD